MSAIDDAIVSTLYNDALLTTYLADGANGVGHGRVLPGTKTPYVIVADIDDDPAYTFGINEAFGEASYRIIVYAADTATLSAEQVADRILGRIKALLHGQQIAISGRTSVVLQRCSRDVSKWTTISDREQVYRDGHKWRVWSAPTG